MPERIDAYTHVLPKRFYDELVAMQEIDDHQMSDARYLWDIERRLDDMGANGVDRQVLTLARPPTWRSIGPEDALPLVRLANDEIARICAEHPDRFIPTGTIPYATEPFLEEFDRCIDDLEMAGVQVFTNVAGQPVDSPVSVPLFERAAAHDVPVWLHPQTHDWYDWTTDFEDEVLGWLYETSLALCRLVFSGVLERNPNLDVITHHMGAMIPHFSRRILSLYEVSEHFPDQQATLSRPAEEYFQRFYADTVLNGSVTGLECGLGFFGTDQVVFATDYPFGPEDGRRWLADTVEGIEQLDIAAAERDAINSRNIRSLLRI